MHTNMSNGVAVDIEMGVTKATSDGSPLANRIVDIEARAGNTNMVSQEELLSKTASIYKVPAYKRELNPRAFTPMLVSFGPFHYDHPEFKKMEIHKERALDHFHKRTNQSLRYVKQEVAKIIAGLRDAYYCLDDRWKTNDEEFLKMMILDGCFTLEILQIHRGERGYSDQDPYFSPNAAQHKLPYIRRDMLLIENQLPLLLLKTLVQFQNLNFKGQDDINQYITSLVLNLVADNGYTTTSTTMGLHALDLFRHSLLGSAPQPHQTQSEPSQTQFEPLQTQFEPRQTQRAHFQSEPLETQFAPCCFISPQNQRTGQFARLRTPEIQSEQPQTQPELNIIPCAVELEEAGVVFKKSETNNLKNIKFESGKFHLPFLLVDETTECSLLNVITFEYLHANLAPDVTTYVTVMNEIISSANDVRLLHNKGLILNMLGSDEEVAHIFNCMGKEIIMHDDDDLSEARKNVSQYCSKRRHRWRAYLMSTYFRNPWNAISLAGALLAIALIIAKIVYAFRLTV